MSETGPQPKRMLRAEFDRQNAEEQSRAAEQQRQHDALVLERLSHRLTRFLRYNTDPPASWVTQEIARTKVGITERDLQAILASDGKLEHERHFETMEIEENDGQVTLLIKRTRSQSLHAERQSQRAERHSHRRHRHDSNRETPPTCTLPA